MDIPSNSFPLPCCFSSLTQTRAPRRCARRKYHQTKERTRSTAEQPNGTGNSADRPRFRVFAFIRFVERSSVEQSRKQSCQKPTFSRFTRSSDREILRRRDLPEGLGASETHERGTERRSWNRCIIFLKIRENGRPWVRGCASVRNIHEPTMLDERTTKVKKYERNSEVTCSGGREPRVIERGAAVNHEDLVSVVRLKWIPDVNDRSAIISQGTLRDVSRCLRIALPYSLSETAQGTGIAKSRDPSRGAHSFRASRLSFTVKP